MPHTPRSEDIRLEPTLNITPEGSLTELPTIVKGTTREQLLEGETLGTSSEMAYMEFPNTQVKTIPKDPDVPKSLQGTKEVSRAENWCLLDNSLLLLIKGIGMYPLGTK